MKERSDKPSLVWPWAVAAFTIVGATLVLRNAFDDSENAAGTLALWSLALAAIWLVGGLLLIRLTSNDRELPRRWSRSWSPLTTVAVISLGISAFSFVGGWILSLWAPTSEWIRDALATATSVPLIVTVTVALVAGAAEEVFFRLGLTRLFSGIWVWIVPTLAYAAATLATGNTALALIAPVLGIAATAALVITRAWWSPLVVHATWTIAMVWIFPLVVAS